MSKSGHGCDIYKITYNMSFIMIHVFLNFNSHALVSKMKGILITNITICILY